MKEGLLEKMIQHLPKAALRTYLNLEEQLKSLFGEDYENPPARRFAPWQYYNNKNFYQQCEYEASG